MPLIVTVSVDLESVHVEVDNQLRTTPERILDAAGIDSKAFYLVQCLESDKTSTNTYSWEGRNCALVELSLGRAFRAQPIIRTRCPKRVH